MKITFFTIVLNGMPFLPYLIDSLADVSYEWFFIEGAVLPKHCTTHCNLPPPWSYDSKSFLSTETRFFSPEFIFPPTEKLLRQLVE